MKVIDRLRELTESVGPSGAESQVADVIRQYWKPFIDDITIDKLGNLIAFKRGLGAEPRPRILIATHMDEIALMVKELISSGDLSTMRGFVRVTNIGGVDKRQLLGQTVTVHGSSGDSYIGIVGALPSWMLPQSKRNKALDYDELTIDLGMSYQELKKKVSVGDFVTFRQPLRKLLGDRVTAKSLDNRASITALTLCLESLIDRRHDWDVVAIGTAQEETGLRGAYTSAFSQDPDIAVAVDVTFGKGPGANDESAFEQGGGPTIGLGPNFHPGMYKALMEMAKSLEMKVHTEPLPQGRSGTDAAALQIARAGVPTALVSIPIRYMHTMVETVSLADIERVGRLLSEFVTRLDENFLDNLGKELID